MAVCCGCDIVLLLAKCAVGIVQVEEITLGYVAFSEVFFFCRRPDPQIKYLCTMSAQDEFMISRRGEVTL